MSDKHESKIQSKEDIKTSKHFCMAPWMHMYILPDLKTLPCCVTSHEDSYGHIGEKSILEGWNSTKFKDMRKKLLNDEPVYSCDYCYTLEKSGVESMRNRLNDQYLHHVEELKTTASDGSLSNLKLRYLDFRFSNFCNFKCRGCSPTLSTSWYEDHEKLWDFKSEEPKVVNEIKYHPEIWKELEDQFPNLEEAYFAGGEPLMMDEHYKTLEYFIANNLVDVRLNYNTNLSVLKFKNYDLIEMWKKFKRVNIMISLDEIEERGEYFRSGLIWQRLLDNIAKIKNELPHAQIRVNCTISLFNISRIPTIHSFLYQSKIINESGFCFNTLVTPECYRSQVLPASLKKKIKFKAYFYIKSLEVKHPEVNWIDFKNSYINQIEFMLQEDRGDLLEDFRERTNKLDLIREENFKETFPEISELLD